MISSWQLKPFPENKLLFFIIHHVLATRPSPLSPLVLAPWIRLGLFSWLRFAPSTFAMFWELQFGMENLVVWCVFHAPPLNCGVSVNKFRADNLRLAAFKTIDTNRMKLDQFETVICFLSMLSSFLKILHSFLYPWLFKMMFRWM